MAYMKKNCSGCCSGCNNGYAQVDYSNGYSARSGCGCNRGCSGCNHHRSCGSCSSSGCSSCGSGCSSCRSRGAGCNGFGTLRSVTGPFSNCGNWWSNDSCFPYYTGPCGPCEPCCNCCCPDWPWPPMPPLMPVNYGYGYPYHSGYGGRNDDHCHYSRCADDMGYTSNKNCYRTEASSHEACAAKRVKPIVEYYGHKHSCDDDC